MAYKKKGIVAGALILTTASVITRILGFIYRVYMSKTIGAEGMGLYQLIVPLYSLAWSISCSGFTLTISKLVSSENAKKQYGNMGRILKQSLVITCSIAILISAIMFFFASFISRGFIHDERVTLSLQILSFAFPFMAAGSCARGYFFGMQESSVPAISQVLEQVVRMLVIYLLAGTFISKGLEYACAAAVIGILFGELISSIYVIYSYFMFKRKHGFVIRPSLLPKESFTMIMTMALPLTFNRIVGSLLAAVENLMIPSRLEMFGHTSKQAIILYGQISGMAMPLIFFPSAILFALSATLVPAISEASAVNNKKRIIYTVNKALLFTSVIGICAATIFIVFPNELGMIIYNQNIQDNRDFSEMLTLLGLMCPIWYLSITFSGILNGLGQQVFMFRNSLISSAINIGFILFFVPRYDWYAFIVGWFVSLVVVTILEIGRIKRCTDIKIPIIKWFINPLLAALATGLTVEYLAKVIIIPVFGELFGVIISIAAIVAIFAILVLMLGVISMEEITSLFRGLPIRKLQQASPKEKSIMG